MKIKFLFWSAAVTLVLGIAFWHPAALTSRAGNLQNFDSHSEDAHPVEGNEAGHAGHDDHDDHEEIDAAHAGHAENNAADEHGAELVSLSAAELQEFGIRLATAGAGSLEQYVELPGEIVLNADRMAHVVPRVAGIVREVRVSAGDALQAGELLAVIESRELADYKAAFLAAAEREKLALAGFQREERLWQKKVTSEQEFLDARQALTEARIARNSAEQQLHALGFSDQAIRQLPEHPDAAYTFFEIRAPLAGTIIEKHLTLGEYVSADADIFTIADLSSVWLDINVYQKDLAQIRQGQSAEIEIGHGIPSVVGTIAWVGPLVGEETRTAKARVVLANPEGTLRPGLFVTARVTVGSIAAGLVAPKSALQTFEDRTVLFVQTGEGFVPQPVEIGRRNTTSVEILAGLAAGQTYVSEGAFTLKAQLSKSAFGDGHNH